MNKTMRHDELIYVAGHRGLVGSALVRRLRTLGYTRILTKTHSELDLTNQSEVLNFFNKEKPDHVMLAAGKVGGIVANNSYPAEFIQQNLMIQTNVIHAAYLSHVKKLLCLGSSCIYPKLAPQPIKEEFLLTSALEATNEAYAIAKIAGLKMCAAYNRQYGTNFISVMPTNLYGPGDNYDLTSSHVMPALIRKIHEAKKHLQPEVVIWGSGTPRREFLHSDDLASACVYLMERHDAKDLGEFINIGTGSDISIRELAELIIRVAGYKGQVVFDTSKPDGTPRKLLDVSRLTALGWRASINLETGIRLACEDYLRTSEKNVEASLTVSA